MKLGVLGGTFDPVHVGHLLLAETAREELALERVLFVPAGQPWRKAGREIAPAGHRVAMLRLAIAGNPSFEVSMAEVDQPGPSYSAETLSKLHEQYPESQLYFIVGLDALLDMPHWRDPETIRRLATIVVAGRDREGPPEGVAEVQRLRMPRIDVSATDIRDRLRQGRSVRYLVPDTVGDYIRQHALYR